MGAPHVIEAVGKEDPDLVVPRPQEPRHVEAPPPVHVGSAADFAVVQRDCREGVEPVGLEKDPAVPAPCQGRGHADAPAEGEVAVGHIEAAAVVFTIEHTLVAKVAAQLEGVEEGAGHESGQIVAAVGRADAPVACQGKLFHAGEHTRRSMGGKATLPGLRTGAAGRLGA